MGNPQPLRDELQRKLETLESSLADLARKGMSEVVHGEGRRPFPRG